MSTRSFVDLSRVDTGLTFQVTSFLGLSRELLNLALTCEAFGRRRQSVIGRGGGTSVPCHGEVSIERRPQFQVEDPSGAKYF